MANDRQLHAVDPRAVDRIDLLTVVEHELGHVAGLDDLDSANSPMAERPGTGVRRDIGNAEVDALLTNGGCA
jgi:hypothetical protein